MHRGRAGVAPAAMTQVRLGPVRLRAVGHGMHLGGWDADASSLVIALVPGSSFPYIYRRLGGSAG